MGLRWWCHECIAQGHPDCSGGCRGKAKLRRWLVEHEIRHMPLAQFGGQTFDFYLPTFRLLIEVETHIGAGLNRQQKQHRWQQQLTERKGLRILRVHRDDPGIIEQMRQELLKPRPR